MPHIDDALVAHLAKLARLDLSPEERALFAPQLDRVLKYVELLQSVDITGVEPLFHAVPLADVMRDDTPLPSLDPAIALANAPQESQGFFCVPPVLDRGN